MGLLQTLAEAVRISAPEKTRSSKWPKVRAAHLVNHGECAVCGSLKTLEVHHIVPFSEDPKLELDPKNLITLCECSKGGIVCHLAIGHLGNYSSHNETVVEDAKIWNTKIKTRPTN
jgi:5-methylcytosine-specific restriction protein A